MLPWRLKADLKRFRQITMGHPIVMGRTTFDTIRRPLPGRRNVVISHDESLEIDGCEVTHSLQDAFLLCGEAAMICVIGGGSIYEQAMESASRIYLTLVHALPEGDVFFRYS